MTDAKDLSRERREYDQRTLRRVDLHQDPLAFFQLWLDEAMAAGLTDATAMSLATTDLQGDVSVRIVLLKDMSPDGLVFYTDYRSQKGRQLAENPRAQVLFYWRELERQVRIGGRVAKVSRDASAAYFASRPIDSQVSAAASSQSSPIESREKLEAHAAEIAEAGDIQAPEEWGGYVLAPQQFEFWQGRAGRLHDRFTYRTDDAGGWYVQRLQP